MLFARNIPRHAMLPLPCLALPANILKFPLAAYVQYAPPIPPSSSNSRPGPLHLGSVSISMRCPPSCDIGGVCRCESVCISCLYESCVSFFITPLRPRSKSEWEVERLKLVIVNLVIREGDWVVKRVEEIIATRSLASCKQESGTFISPRNEWWV